MNWDEQIACRTLWGECRGEPEEGQRAVAHVLLNRLRDGRWGKTLAAVCLARKQFSCWNHNDPQRDRMALLDDNNLTAQARILLLSKSTPDPTNGALFYFADSIPEPYWVKDMKFLVKIGHHSFYTDRKET